MSVSVGSICQISVPIASKVQGHFDTSKSMPRWRQKSTVIRCYNKRAEGRVRAEKNYYDLLGISVKSNAQEIKEAYRKLQKKYHPDIAGQEGHEYTLMLNEAYKVLMKEDLRRQYDASIGHMRVRNGTTTYSGLAYSAWKGPLRPQALFVDENACIGCGQCAQHACNTFVMDEALACARVKVQYGDDEQKIEVSVESCPVNCIHWVDREELPALEFLIQPQPKEGYGIYGGGWERPANVFMAAKSFTKQLKQQDAMEHHQTRATREEETPAQAEARANASRKLKEERLSRIWNWMKEIFSSNMLSRD
ncbi:hypothetical protein ACB092_01G299300 [Castanea dentata]